MSNKTRMSYLDNPIIYTLDFVRDNYFRSMTVKR